MFSKPDDTASSTSLNNLYTLAGLDALEVGIFGDGAIIVGDRILSSEVDEEDNDFVSTTFILEDDTEDDVNEDEEDEDGTFDSDDDDDDDDESVLYII